MIILTTSTANQTLKVIPREYASNFSLSVRDDSTNVTKVYEITNATTVGDYLNVTLAFSPILVENHFYDLTYYSDPNFWNTNYFLWNVYQELWNVDTTEIIDIYKDKIFVTNQEIDQDTDKYYKLNQGQYKTNNSYNNDYLVI